MTWEFAIYNVTKNARYQDYLDILNSINILTLVIIIEKYEI